MNKHFLFFTSFIIFAIVFNHILIAIGLYLLFLFTRKKTNTNKSNHTDHSIIHLLVIIFFSSFLFGCDDK